MIWRALWTCTARLALCPTHAAPLTFIISAFRNRQRLMDYIFQGRAMVAIKRGNRRALVPEDCSARVEILAKRHLLGR